MRPELRLGDVPAVDRDRVRQLGCVVLTVGGILAASAGDYGSAEATANPLIPADPAFGIWLPIYAGCLGYAAYQAVPSQARRSVHRRVGVSLSLCAGLTGTWVWLQEPPLLQLPAIAATLWAGGLAYRRAVQIVEGPADRWLIAAPAGLLLGWLTLAAVVASTEVAAASGLRAPAPNTLSLAVISALAVLGARSRRHAPAPQTYAAALAWGLLGIAAQSRRRAPLRALTAAAGAVNILRSRRR